jgi:hypothetical protein
MLNNVPGTLGLIIALAVRRFTSTQRPSTQRVGLPGRQATPTASVPTPPFNTSLV